MTPAMVEPSIAQPGIIAKMAYGYGGAGEFQLELDLKLPGQGVSALSGPSGCGKTTFLRCMAGLLRPSRGYLEVNGEVWQDSQRQYFLPTHRRALGYVFQEASLLPHLSVSRNLDYGARRSKAAPGAAPRQKIIEMLGIGPLLQAMPSALSGGERQRVAMARALFTAPRLLLMDEPMAALDNDRKRDILPYLERLRDELAIPILYISHHPEEIARLADTLVLMRQGSCLASGPLATLLSRLDLPLAHAEDAGAVIEAKVAAHDETYHLTRLVLAGGEIFVPRRELPVGQPVRLQIHARDVSLALSPSHDSSILNRLPATVLKLAPAQHPAHVLVMLDAGGEQLLARITRRSCDQLALVPGQPVWAQIKSVALL